MSRTGQRERTAIFVHGMAAGIMLMTVIAILVVTFLGAAR